MKRLIMILLLFVVGSATAANVTIVAENKKLTVTVPDGWKLGFENKTRFNQIREYIPKNQTMPQWKDMITLQSYSGLGQVPADEFINDMAPRIKQQCKEFKPVITSGDKVASMLAYCSKYKQLDQGEITFFKVMKSGDVLFVVQRAWRGKPFSLDKIPMTDKQRKAWEKFIASVKLG